MSYAIVPYRGGSSPVVYEGVIEEGPAPRRRRAPKRAPKRNYKAGQAPVGSREWAWDEAQKKTKRRKAKKTSAKKKATRKKKRTPAQIAATKRLVAANKARRGGKKTAGRKRKTSQKSARRSAPKRKKARRGPVGGAVRLRGASGRAVTLVAPHKSAHSPCPSCGRYHDLRQHWSHKKGPHAAFTRTEASYMCSRYGVCGPAKPKKKSVKKTKKRGAIKRRQSVQKPMTRAQALALAVRQKWQRRAKKGR